MQDRDPVLFDGDTARKLGEMYRDYNSQPRPGFGYAPAPVNTVSPIHQKVQVTGAAITAGYYPAKTLNWDNVDQVDVDGPECRIREINGEELEIDQVIPVARLVGVDVDGSDEYPVFETKKVGAAAVGLDYVYPWRWVDVDFGPPLYGATFTQKCLLYQRHEFQLDNMTSSSGYPELADIVTPGDDFWLDPGSGPRWDPTPVLASCGEILPLYSDSNTSPASSSTANYYDGATAAAWYLNRMGALPRVLGRFPLSDSETVDKFGGGTMPIQADDNHNTSGHTSFQRILAYPFLATVKYKALTSPTAVFGVTSTGYTWKNSAGTLKSLYFWFFDPMGLLANTGSDQQVLVTPVNSQKMDATFTKYNGTGGTPGATIPSEGLMYIITARF